jgi:mono/diheme cytochrome c family protein
MRVRPERTSANPRVRLRPRWLAAGMLLLAGCANEMDEQPKYQRPYQESKFFADGRSARPLMAGTIPRGFLRDDTAFYAGQKGDLLIDEIPMKIDRAAIERGRDRYNIYCLPCHSPTGDGQGMIVKRGFSPPPTFHQDRLREAPSGHFYHVISNGYGAMYSYASRVAPEDRWKIVAYIRTLQLSQNAKLDDIPASEQSKLKEAAR